jgi:mechanosensitive ion channel-like protein
MDKFMEIFTKLINQSSDQISGIFTQYGPAVLFAIAVVLTGWIIAILVRKIMAKLLRALGFDVLLEKTGFKKILKRGGLEMNPSSIVSWLLYWTVMINTLIMAQEALDLKVTMQFLGNIFTFLPNFIMAIIILSLGFYVGGVVSKLAEKTALFAKNPFSKLIGILARYTIVGLAVMFVLDIFDLSARIGIDPFLLIFVIVPSIALLTFIVGGRDVIASMFEGRFLQEMIKKGDTIEVDGITGEIINIGIASTLIKTSDSEVIIPNAELAHSIIKKKTK